MINNTDLCNIIVPPKACIMKRGIAMFINGIDVGFVVDQLKNIKSYNKNSTFFYLTFTIVFCFHG